jgi:hypothetical protein
MRIPPVFAVAVALVAAATVSAAAPRTRSSSAGDGAPDVYGGYSWTHAGEARLHGWTLAGSYPFSDLRFVAELGGHYGSFAGADLSQYSLMAGVRGVFRRDWPVRPFAETLVGPVRTSASVAGQSSGDTDWGLAFGAGGDYAVDDRWALRGLVQLRLIRGEGSTDKDPRISVGVVYRLDE